MSKAYQTALKMIREGLANALSDPVQGPLIREVLFSEETLTAFVAAVAANGAAGIGYANDGSKLGGALDLQAVGDYAAASLVDKAAATDPVPTDAVQDGDAVVLHRADGTWPIIDAGLLLRTGPNNLVKFSSTNYDVTLADVGRTIVAESPGDCTVTLLLHATEPIPIGAKLWVLNRAGGSFSVVCDDPSIILNEASNGTVSAARGEVVELMVVDPDDWHAKGGAVASTADLTPPTIESIDPPNGSTILLDTVIRVRFTEGIQPSATSKLITQRQSSGGGAYADDGTVDVTAAFGTGLGKISVSNRDLFIYPITARVEDDSYAYRIAAGAFRDFATPTPNEFAGAVTDSVIGPFTVAVSSAATMDVVNSGSFVIDPGSSAGARQTKQMSSTPSNGDMTIAIGSCAGALTVDAGMPNALPTGFTSIYDRTAEVDPAAFLAQRIEGAVPSRDIQFRTHFSRRQAAYYLVVRGTGGTLQISTTAQANGTGEANAPALAQGTANEIRIISHHIDSKDLTPTYAALTSAGWNVLPPANTGLGSTTEGTTLVVAWREEGGTLGQSIDPPALSGASGTWRSFHVGIKET